MKYLILAILALVAFSACEHGHGHHHAEPPVIEKFDSKMISQSATIQLHGNIETTYPLFNPIEEPKWAPVFKPYFIYPSDQKVQKGMSFKTAGIEDEPEFLWIITQYEPNQHLIQYLVNTPNRYFFITVECSSTLDHPHLTKANITYEFYALTSKGIELNQHFLDRIFANDLKDWETAINGYLEKT